MRHLSPVLSAAVAAILCCPSVTLAQSVDATLRGTAPANTTVTARNVATGLTRRAQSSASGSYTLAGLPPGTYRVDAGAGSETLVTLSVASTATLNLVTGTGTSETEAPIEEVVVTGRRLNEVRTSEVATTVSPQLIETVPQLTRNFLEFADTVPGVVFEVDSSGRTSIRGGAQGKNGVNLYIDGVGQKGYVRSGISGQGGDTQGNPFPQLAIGEYKVITSNYKAEYDQISSAAITALTRSGTNEFQGEAFGTYSADNWRARTPAELETNTKAESEVKEFGAAFGGPIIQDVMHFFVTYEGKRYSTPKIVIADNSAPAALVAALPPDAAAQLGPASIEFVEDLFFGKIDWEPTDQDRFTLSVKVRDETGEGDQTGTGVAASAAIDTDNDETRYEFQWNRTGAGWLNELTLTYEDAFFVPHVSSSGVNGSVYTFNPPANSRILAVDGSDPRAGQNKGQKGWAVGDNITFSDIGWFGGDHTIKAGIKYKKIELTAQDAVINNPVFYYDVTAAGTAAAPYRALFAQPVAGYSPVVTSDDEQLGVFVQDDWVINEHLTLNLGLRWDIEWNPSYLDFETPQFLIDSLNSEVAPGVTYAESLGLSSDPDTAYDINDYISNGGNRSAQDDAFAPRFGFSYDIGGDQRHVIFGGAGRAYDRNLYDYLQLEQTKFALATGDVRFNVPDHPCVVNGSSCVNFDPAFTQDIANLQALLTGLAGEVDLINNELETPYSDQFSLGMRNGIGDWNTSVAVSYIESKEGFVFSLGNRRPDGSFWNPTDPNDRGQPWGFPPPGLAGNLLIGDNGITTRSTQLLLSAEKPFTQESRWGATVSYTYTDAEQNRDINEHFAFDQVSIDQYPFILSNAAAKHRLVGTGSWAGPWGLTVAGKLTLATPTPRNLISCLIAPAFFENGAPCTALAYEPDTTLGYKSLDLQITKDFEIRDFAAMYLRVDALNLTNEHNLVDVTDVTGANGLVTGGDFNPIGNITGVPRTFRMTFGVKF
jgi:outer membrane receptor protein involved in Fe transport